MEKQTVPEFCIDSAINSLYSTDLALKLLRKTVAGKATKEQVEAIAEDIGNALNKLASLRFHLTNAVKPGSEIMGKTFTYHVNLDERGCFYADVRDPAGETVYEIKIENADPDRDNWDESIFADGFMSHRTDVRGLRMYLIDLGIITADDELSMG